MKRTGGRRRRGGRLRDRDGRARLCCARSPARGPLTSSPERADRLEGRAKVTDFGIAARWRSTGRPDRDRARAWAPPTTSHPSRPSDARSPSRSDDLLAGRRDVRDAHRRGPVPGRDAGRGRHRAREGTVPDVQHCAPRSRRALASVRRALHRQGATGNRYAIGRGHDRGPRGGAGHRGRRTGERRARPRPCCVRCRATPQGFVPVRLRKPRRSLLIGARGPAARRRRVAYFAYRTEKGGGPPSTPAPPASRASLASSAANDYDPEGDDRGSPELDRRTCSTATPPPSGTPSATRTASRAWARPAWACSSTPARRSRAGRGGDDVDAGLHRRDVRLPTRCRIGIEGWKR